MSVERYPSNDTARRARSFRAIRPHGKPPGYQKDFTPRDKRGRPLKDREGIKKPKQIPKGSAKAAAQLGRKLLRGRISRMLELGQTAVGALNRLDEWSDSLIQFDDVLTVPGLEGPDPQFWEMTKYCTEWEGEWHRKFRGGDPCGKSNSIIPPNPYYVYGTAPSHTLNGFTLFNFNQAWRDYVYLQPASEWQKKAGTTPEPGSTWVVRPGSILSPTSELTWEFPLEWPTPQKWADAVAIPGSQPDGSPEPKKQPSRKDAQTSTVTVPLVPGLAVVLVPVTEVVPVPETQVITYPAPPDAPVTVISRSPPETISAPPKGRRVKERKLTLMAAAPMTWALINFGTEAIDFLGVLHDSLPEDLRAKRKSGWSKPKAHEMAEAVYNHYDKIDLASAVENYVNEWIEDQWFGRSGIAGKKLNQMTGNSTGADRALTQGGAGPGEAPEVHLDVETGEWEVTTPWGNFSGNMSRGSIDYNR